MLGSCRGPREHRQSNLRSRWRTDASSARDGHLRNECLTGDNRFGIEELDRSLGGVLLPGTLTVVAGATGRRQDPTRAALGRRRLARRGASRRSLRLDQPRRFPESRARMPRVSSAGRSAITRCRSRLISTRAWDFTRPLGDYFHPVDRAGRRVTRATWMPTSGTSGKADLSRVLRCATGFFYQHFARGTRRVVFDGLEPARAIQRIDPVRVLRVRLPSRAAPG